MPTTRGGLTALVQPSGLGSMRPLQGLAVVFDELRFVIPRLQLAAGAGTEYHKNIPGLGGVVRIAWSVGPGGIYERIDF